MNIGEIVLYSLIGLNVLVSFKGFSDINFFESFLFSSKAIRYNKEFIRFISSGFLHADYMHLFFNMFGLYMFGKYVVPIGWGMFLLIYIGSLLFGNILSFIIHANSSIDYRAIGASGAVSGIMFAYVIISPESEIYSFFIPFGIPSWIYAIGYMALSIYGISKRSDNIGHEAHLGGAIGGMLITILLLPELLDQSPRIVSTLLLSATAILFIIVYQPHLIGLAKKPGISRSEEYSLVNEWNYLADKGNRLGEDALTENEKLRMKEIDRKLKKRFF